ncbi:MAG: AAA family ATPase, partial [Clostridia bacterium]|nr:AAA family ATPase [Clostridia bacterium]
MFLKEFAIRRYGPLADSGKRLLGSFNLFYGPNEDGKTLTIDALLKMLFGKVAVRYFDAVKRVEEKPEGYLIIETGAPKEVKLPEAGTISDLSGLSIAEFSNIFVIRDSDLAISEESDFYRGITNRLTGIRSDEIRKIKERLCELGRITAGGEFKNTEPGKLKDRLKKVQILLEKIKPIPALFQEEGFGRFEEELARHEENYRETTEKLNQLRAVSHRERYEKGRRALDLIQKAQVDLSELKPYTQVDYETWQRAESSIEHLQNDQSKLEMEITANKETLSAARSVIKTAALAYKILEKRLEEAFKKIEPLLADYDQEHLLFLKRETLIRNLFFNRVVLAAILVFILSLTGLIIRPSLWLFITLSVSGLLSVILSLLRFGMLKKESRLGTIEAQACIEAEKLGLPSGDIHAVRSGLGGFKSDLNLEAEKLSEAKNEIEWQQKALERLTGQLEEKLRIVMETEENIIRMRQALSIDTLAKFKALLKRQQVLNNEIDNQKSLLESHFGRRGELHSEEGRLNFW